MPGGIDLRRLERDERFARVGELATRWMAQLGEVIPVLPVSLVSTVFLAAPDEALAELELKARIQGLIRRLEARGAQVYIPRADRDYAITVGLRMLLLRRLVDEVDGLYRARRSELPLLSYYAGSIAHLVEAAEA